MGRMIETAKAFLDGEGMHYGCQGDWLLAPMTHEMGKWQVFISENNECLLCMSNFPVNAPLERRAAVMEMLMQWNYQLLIGNWEMDLDDGEIRYRTSVPLRGVELTVELVRHICGFNFSTFSGGFSDLLAVIYQNRSYENLRAEREKTKVEIQAEFEESMRKLGFEEEPPVGDGAK